MPKITFSVTSFALMWILAYWPGYSAAASRDWAEKWVNGLSTDERNSARLAWVFHRPGFNSEVDAMIYVVGNPGGIQKIMYVRPNQGAGDQSTADEVFKGKLDWWIVNRGTGVADQGLYGTDRYSKEDHKLGKAFERQDRLFAVQTSEGMLFVDSLGSSYRLPALAPQPAYQPEFEVIGSELHPDDPGYFRDLTFKKRLAYQTFDQSDGPAKGRYLILTISEQVLPPFGFEDHTLPKPNPNQPYYTWNLHVFVISADPAVGFAHKISHEIQTDAVGALNAAPSVQTIYSTGVTLIKTGVFRQSSSSPVIVTVDLSQNCGGSFH